MIIFYHINYPKGLGADRWIYEGWRNAFIDLGHHVVPYPNCETITPDLLMTSYSLWRSPADYESARRELGGKVAMFVDNDFRYDRSADLFYGERSKEQMHEFIKAAGQPYHLIPNAADKTIHFPVEPVETYQCDIAYIGAYLPKKKEQFKRLLLPLLKKYQVRIYGPYWTWKDLALLAGNTLSRRLRWQKAADWFNERRLTLPAEDEQKLYSSAKISLNVHEREQGRDYDLVNQRTFKIPACGGFEICDNVASLRRFFSPEEMVMAKDDDDWFKKIDYYLTHEKERLAIKNKGTARALRDHTYHHRVRQLFKLL